ncbi:hypothetical protein FIBSPDRAFT_886917 [Athelia psychrophila]|uniref:Uncharacterized protein n=1 Tax=Athelia psychrophila TaxID=1759441 RepID=A0A166QDK1_9AGAM|nr:hypothetical protein FIBSPDRAFT_886917 [Fibularhizoctonia sp. CBS 109695]
MCEAEAVYDMDLGDELLSNELSVVMATAMACGASSSDVIESKRTLNSPDGEITVTCTQVTFTFYSPYDKSPYRTPKGATITSTTCCLLRGDWPYPPRAPPNSRPSSPISIPTTRSSSPNDATLYDMIPEAAQLDKETASTHTRRVRHVLRTNVPAADRWYSITRGRRVGVVQGAHLATGFTHRVSGSQLVQYPTKELAEAAFDVALQTNLVEVLN